MIQIFKILLEGFKISWANDPEINLQSTLFSIDSNIYLVRFASMQGGSTMYRSNKSRPPHQLQCRVPTDKRALYESWVVPVQTQRCEGFVCSSLRSKPQK